MHTTPRVMIWSQCGVSVCLQAGPGIGRWGVVTFRRSDMTLPPLVTCTVISSQNAAGFAVCADCTGLSCKVLRESACDWCFSQLLAIADSQGCAFP